VYRLYQKKLKSNNALDFDDLILKTVDLFSEHPEVLAFYQNKFRYILVDEYQDTNTPQYRLVHLLSQSHRNLCVVGDDDQSIYKFRGANIENILNFEAGLPGGHGDKAGAELPFHKKHTGRRQPRHSEQQIAARRKKLWTQKPEGYRVRYYVRPVHRKAGGGLCCVHEAMRLCADGGIGSYPTWRCCTGPTLSPGCWRRPSSPGRYPTRWLGSLGFYQRKEIKDLLAYLKGNTQPGGRCFP
jgi:DNA helicase-2/ATP-dependent DNA helicase PcrA